MRLNEMLYSKKTVRVASPTKIKFQQTDKSRGESMSGRYYQSSTTGGGNASKSKSSLSQSKSRFVEKMQTKQILNAYQEYGLDGQQSTQYALNQSASDSNLKNAAYNGPLDHKRSVTAATYRDN